MTGYKINFAANTITITAAFEAAANNLASEEYRLLKQIQADYPAVTISRKTHRSPKTCSQSKGLTYANMERYIKVYKNAAELLERFKEVKELSAVQINGYKYVKSWFATQFPNYKQLPDFTSLNLIAEVKAASARTVGDNKAA
jgi:hypothetical protein